MDHAQLRLHGRYGMEKRAGSGARGALARIFARFSGARRPATASRSASVRAHPRPIRDGFPELARLRGRDRGRMGDPGAVPRAAERVGVVGVVFRAGVGIDEAGGFELPRRTLEPAYASTLVGGGCPLAGAAGWWPRGSERDHDEHEGEQSEPKARRPRRLCLLRSMTHRGRRSIYAPDRAAAQNKHAGLTNGRGALSRSARSARCRSRA